MFGLLYRRMSQGKATVYSLGVVRDASWSAWAARQSGRRMLMNSWRGFGLLVFRSLLPLDQPQGAVSPIPTPPAPDTRSYPTTILLHRANTTSLGCEPAWRWAAVGSAACSAWASASAPEAPTARDGRPPGSSPPPSASPPPATPAPPDAPPPTSSRTPSASAWPL